MRISIYTAIFLLFLRQASAQVLVTVDTSQHFQTIEGWGHGGSIFSNLNYSVDPAIRDSINLQYLDYIIDELGLTGSRMWEVGPRVDGIGLDNGDCDSLDWTKFQVTQTDSMIARYALYFKNRIEANGYRTSFYSSPTYATAATILKPWVLNHPGERAQQIWANALWWKNNYGIDINYDVIYNEPGSPVTTQILVDDIKALGTRLIDHGLKTRSQYAEAVAPQTDWNFITPVQNDSDFWKYVGRLSYHNYGTADPYREDIRDFAKDLGMTTAQTEMGNPTADDLYNDLTLGGVSYWEIAFSGQNTLAPESGNTSWIPSNTYFRLRQILHYVHPEAIRVGGNTSDSMTRVLAFKQADGITTVIFLADNPTINFTGLPAGKYGLSTAISGATAVSEQGIKTVGADGKLTITVQAGKGSAVTLYPYNGANHPPEILYAAVNPGFLILPNALAQMVAKVSDPENDHLTIGWSVYSQPQGANATFNIPNLINATIGGMTVPGNYIFLLTLSDGVSTVTKKVYMVVYPQDQHPVLGAAGFRFPAPYGLVFSDAGDTTHAYIELPVSSATLQVQIGDLANSNFTGRGKWTLISQPPGANTKLDTTIYIYVSIRAQVSNMLVPGDYVFQVNVTDSGHSDLVTRVICTVHSASAGPVIAQIAATPSVLTLPQDSSNLSATTTDPQGQLLRHWWYVKSVPKGAYPVFDHQGLPNSHVSGLTIPGIYTFTLRTFDDLHMTTKDLSITVKQSSGRVTAENSNASIAVYPNPAADEIRIHYPKAQGMLQIKIVNLVGEVVLEKLIFETNDDLSLPLYSLPSGMYSVLMISNGSVKREKIIRR